MFQFGKRMEFFLGSFNKKYGFCKSLDPQALQLILEYCWPGNVRELKNVVERAMIISNGDSIETEDLPYLQQEKKESPRAEPPAETTNLKKMIEQIELDHINSAYAKRQRAGCGKKPRHGFFYLCPQAQKIRGKLGQIGLEAVPVPSDARSKLLH